MSAKYNDLLEKIIDKYGYKPEALADSKQIHNMIKEMFFTRCPKKKIAIWGVGKNNTVNSHAAVILTKYALELNGLSHLIDSNRDLHGKQFMGFPIIAPSEIRENGIQLVIIASRASGSSIIKNLQEEAPECEFIDIYEELRKKGIVIDYNFFSEQNIYTRLYQLKQEYEAADTRERKENTLHELIARYLEIRDFSYAFMYVQEYCKEGYNQCEQLQKLQQEVENLCKDIKVINKKRNKDIIIHLIDSLRAIDVYDTEDKLKLKMFGEYTEYATLFTEAYSTGPTTYESMLGVVKQKLSYEEDVYDGSKFLFQIQEFQLLQEVLKTDMAIHFYVAKDYLIMQDDVRIQRSEHLHMSEKLWNVACDMAESEKPTFNFIYYPWELHFPLLCGFHRKKPQIKSFSDVGLEDMGDFIESQFEDCIHYVDKQMNYYKDFFSDEMITVFLGDHSQPIYDKKEQKPFFMYYKEPDKVSHIAFLVHSCKIAPKRYPQPVSMLDFNSIMIDILNSNTINVPQREIIQYQYYNMQNKKIREAAKEQGYMDYTEGIQCFLSKQSLYVKTATGVQEVYRISEIKKDIFKDIGDTEEGIAYITAIEDQYDTSFPPFWTVRSDV